MLDGYVGVEQVGFEVLIKSFELIQRQHLANVLVGTNDDDRTLRPVDATQLVNVLSGFQTWDGA